jgi:hypothetical protein
MVCQSERERKQFKCFKDLTKQLNAKGLTEAGKTILIKKLFQLNIETNLLVKIKDIQDELNIVASVLASQYGVLKRLHKLCSTDENAGDDASLPEKSKKKRVLEVGKAADKSEEQPDLLGKPQQKGILHHDNEKEAPLQEKKKEKKQVHFSDGNFRDTEKDTPLLRDHSLVDDNLGIVWGNIQIVQDMQRYADQVHTSVFEIPLSPDAFLLTLHRSIIYLISNSGKRLHERLNFPEKDRSRASGKAM